MKRINVTVITICLNEEQSIKKTLDSVLQQDYLEYEYIVKDGNSSDDTNNIIEEYKDKFDKKGIPFFHYIKQDEGIYDAMNQALVNASGEWIIFMNSGDAFFNSSVLKNVFEYNRYNEKEIIYGHTLYCMSGGYRIVVCSNHKNLLDRKGICQQSCFIKRDLLCEKKFDTNFKILADFDFLLSAYLEKKQFMNINIIVSEYNHEGVSSRSVRAVEEEIIRIYKKHDVFLSKRKSKIRICLSEIFTNKFPVLSDLLVCFKLCRNI